jgi:hypothetical protein
MRLLKSIVVGLISALCLGAFTFVFPLFDAFTVYVSPARISMPLLDRLFPDRFIYWLFPDGGPPAGVFLITVAAVIFWTVVLATMHLTWVIIRQHRIKTAP